MRSAEPTMTCGAMLKQEGRGPINATPSFLFVYSVIQDLRVLSYLRGGWQEGKKVLATILLACPLVAFALGRK